MTGRYATEERALTRVDVLKRSGIWPGVIRHRDGTFGITFDPQDPIVSNED